MTEESACNMAALHDTNKAGLTVWLNVLIRRRMAGTHTKMSRAINRQMHCKPYHVHGMLGHDVRAAQLLESRREGISSLHWIVS